MTGGRATQSRAMLFSHLARAVLFGAAAGWLSSLLSGVTSGWVFYLGCGALATLCGWVLVRPMERSTALVMAVLWVAAGGTYYLLRPPGGAGMLGVLPDIGDYAGFVAVLVSFGVGVLIGKAITKVQARGL